MPDPSLFVVPSGFATILLAIACGSHLVIAIVVGLIARAKERSFAGWAALGILFGIFTLLLVVCFPRRGESFGAGNVIALALLFGIPVVMVPVIGILAAIAIPNFLEAQTRANVARSKAELRDLAVAVETYYVENKAYPSEDQFPSALTTPVPYTSVSLTDPFSPTQTDSYHYRLESTAEGPRWTMWGVGPDQVNDNAAIEYDSTNGTTSRGDVIRHGP